ncbi:hypothetical protein C8J56DRAFT_425493 [Mycena floridula]|nr:hypothetical protein C8J56DRAFT_425493 [Mycena floridula]
MALYSVLYPNDHHHLLPFELVEEIVQYRRRDVSTLRALCLVSNVWRSAAVVHLFSQIKLLEPSHMDIWVALVERTPEIVHRALKKVTCSNRVGSPIPRPVQVHTLHWKNCDKVPPFDFLNFTGVSELHLSGRFRDSDYKIAEFIGRTSSSLKALHLDQLSAERTGFLGVIVPQSVDPNVLDLTRIKEMSFHGSDIEWLQMILPNTQPESLLSLSFRRPTSFLLWPSFASFTGIAANTLQHLVVEATDMFPVQAALVSLVSLDVYIHENHKLIRFFEFLPATPKLATITLVVVEGGLESLVNDIVQLVTFVFPRKCLALERFIVQVEGTTVQGKHDIEREIADAMPGLNVYIQ